MKLLSTVEVSGFKYYVILNDTVGGQEWLLVSEIHPNNYAKVGEAQRENSLPLSGLYSGKYNEYVVEGIKRSKKTGKVQNLKSKRLVSTLGKIMDNYIDARDFTYPKDAIVDNSKDEDMNCREIFRASFNNYYIYYGLVDGIYSSLEFSTTDFDMKFNRNDFIKIPKKLEYLESKRSDSSISIASLPKVDVESLSSVVDLSWYRDSVTKEKKKKYISVTNIPEFESKVVTPMIRTMTREIESGIRPLISCDTETDGLNIYNLDVDNPDRSWISTIQFAWGDNQGVIIYLNMEFHDNVNKEYVMKRFKNLFDYYVRTPKSKIAIIYDEDGTKLVNPEIHEFNRKDYDLVGHNTIFDGRVTLSEDAQYFFDHDTLQMAFNIDPTVTRGSKKLKRLSRYFYQHETPELTDLLGKGNEDKFRYLKEREITEIYGCADVDYTRKLFYSLRELMSDEMFRSYKTIDPITWYLCAQSEFDGMRLDDEGVKINSGKIKEDMDRIQDIIYTYVGYVVQKRIDLSSKGLNPDSLTTTDSEQDDGNTEDFLGSKKVNKYEFKLKGAGVRKVMYNLLKYPVKVRTKKSGLPAVDTDAFSKLLYYKNEVKVNLLKSDVISSDGETVLVEAEKFNSYKYPLCYLLKCYSTLDKEYTTYYKGFEREDLGGRLFKGISTTNIETRRMSSAAQIIKKSLKALIKSHGDDWYLGDWDFDQVEARIFISDAADAKGIEKFKDNEKDYHTENAALMFSLEPYQVSKILRNYAKAIGFGLPYGLSDFKLCERIFTVHSRENDLKTIDLRTKFEHVNKICMEYLETIRSKAIDPVEVPVELKRFWGMPDDAKIGMIKNKHGFYRYFRLDDVLGNPKEEQSKRRQAGNFTIQSFAADLFKFALRRMYDRLVREGIDDRVKFHMYIHDELLFSVHKSIDPRRIAKICAEECMFRLKGHTSYFIGLAFGNSWLECKKDPNEIPSGLLYKIKDEYDTIELKDWTEDACKFVRPIIDEYKVGRALEVLKEIQPSFPDKPLNVRALENSLTNYKVRGYIYESKPCYKLITHLNYENKEVDDDNDMLISCLCSMFTSNGMSDVKLDFEDQVVSVTDYVESRKSKDLVSSTSFVENTELDDLSFEDDFEMESDSYWSFDDDEENDSLESHVYSMYEYDDGEEYSFELPKHSHKYVRSAGKDVLLTCRRPKNVENLRNLVSKYKSTGGKRIVIETIVGTQVLPGKYDINFDTINEFLEGVN